MSSDRVESRTNVRLTLGPFEITCTNLTKDQLNNALKDFLSIAESNSEEVNRIAGKFSGISSQVSSLPKTSTSISGMGSLSITEFVRKIKRNKGTDIALAIAYYLFKYRSVEVITTKELGEAYDEARLTKPANPTDTLNQLVRTAKMKPAPDREGRKAFTITQSGEQEVEAWLSETTTP